MKELLKEGEELNKQGASVWIGRYIEPSSFDKSSVLLPSFLHSPHRLTAQPICQTQPLCRVPPETPEQSDEAEVGATEEKLQKSQNVESQTNHEPPQETEAKKNGKSEVAASAKEEAALPKHKESKKTPAQKKLHDLLSSLASVRTILNLLGWHVVIEFTSDIKASVNDTNEVE